MNTKKYIKEAFVLATILTLALTVITSLATEATFNPFETSAVFFSFACTWLCTRQVRFNYVLGVISTILLSITFWKAGLYGSMALNIYLVPTVIYGWFIWQRDEITKPVQRIKAKTVPIYVGVTILTWWGAFSIIIYFGGSLAPLDGWLLIGSILAQYLLDRKKIENWMIWAAVNVISVYVYWHSGLYLLAIQFGLFLLNNIIAWGQWKKSMLKDENSNITPLGRLELSNE